VSSCRSQASNSSRTWAWDRACRFTSGRFGFSTFNAGLLVTNSSSMGPSEESTGGGDEVLLRVQAVLVVDPPLGRLSVPGELGNHTDLAGLDAGHLVVIELLAEEQPVGVVERHGRVRPGHRIAEGQVVGELHDASTVTRSRTPAGRGSGSLRPSAASVVASKTWPRITGRAGAGQRSCGGSAADAAGVGAANLMEIPSVVFHGA
jgi:hypothetical protein